MSTDPLRPDSLPTADGDSRRMLLSCPACGNSRSVAPVDRAAVGTLSLLHCAACGRDWSEIITPYSRAAQDEV